jgi:hypothetical protein
MEILSVEVVDLQEPKIPNLIQSAEYLITLPAALPDLASRVAALMEAESLPRARRGKPYDLRPLIEALHARDEQHLFMRLAARSNATGRPDEVLLALGVDLLSARVHRSALILAENAAGLQHSVPQATNP